MRTLYARARAYANLTPFERAVLRFIQVALLGALIAGLQAVIPLLTVADPSRIAWPAVERTFLTAALVALLLAVGKYQSAQGDPPLGGLTGASGTGVVVGGQGMQHPPIS